MTYYVTKTIVVHHALIKANTEDEARKISAERFSNKAKDFPIISSDYKCETIEEAKEDWNLDKLIIIE